MKKLILLILISLFTASGWAQGLPDDPRFDTEVTLVTQNEGELLQVMLESLALSVGLSPLIELNDTAENPTVVQFRIAEPKPFRQLWDILISRHNLDYVLLDNDVVVVGTPLSIAEFKPQEPVDITAEPTIETIYRIKDEVDVKEVADLMKRLVPSITVEALPGLQSILVRGTVDEQANVTNLVSEYAPAKVDEVNRELRVYSLSNSDAETLAVALQGSGVLDQAASVAAAAGAEGGEGAAAASSGFTIVADKSSNSLIVNAPEDTHTRIATLISQLDIPKQQVNVQLRIQEITSEEAANLGLNLNGALGNLAVNFLDGGLKFLFDAQTAVSGLNIGAVLDTLERQGLSRKVDDTNITVLNNEEANLKSGGRIEIQFPAPDGSLSTRTLEFGIIVALTPRITRDGRVIVAVEAEVSDLLTPFAEGEVPNRIDFSERTAKSTVTLNPGQTVVLGGLLQNSFQETQTGVPFISDIPILGNLFSSTDINDKNTELLMILTADIIE